MERFIFGIETGRTGVSGAWQNKGKGFGLVFGHDHAPCKGFYAVQPPGPKKTTEGEGAYFGPEFWLMGL